MNWGFHPRELGREELRELIFQSIIVETCYFKLEKLGFQPSEGDRQEFPSLIYR